MGKGVLSHISGFRAPLELWCPLFMKHGGEHPSRWTQSPWTETTSGFALLYITPGAPAFYSEVTNVVSFFLQNRTSYLSAGAPPSITALFVPSWGGLAVCILFGSMNQESVPLGASALLAGAASKFPQEEMKPLPII